MICFDTGKQHNFIRDRHDAHFISNTSKLRVLSASLGAINYLAASKYRTSMGGIEGKVSDWALSRRGQVSLHVSSLSVCLFTVIVHS